MGLDVQLETRISLLLSQMTIEEKVGQMNQQPLTADLSVLEDDVRTGSVGSVVLAYTPFAGRESRADAAAQRFRLQNIACRESRFGIPLLLGRDVLHGHRTVFPIPLAQAAAWDPQLAGRAAAIAAQEAKQDGVNWIFAPMVDICRDPRWGRIIEGYGEDPFLSQAYAASVAAGFQSVDGILACAKHFIGYGASEGGRDYSGSNVSPRQLFEVCLPPFQSAVAAGCATVMAAFNDVNEVPVSASEKLLTRLLRARMGFGGLVVSDWNAIEQLVDQGAAADRREAAKLAFKAGIDIDMCSGCYRDHLPGLIRSGELSVEHLDQVVRRILRAKLQIPIAPPSGSVPIEHARRTALQLAQEAAVLLKNENQLLPLDPDCPVALLGSVAGQRRIHLGSWTLDGNASQCVSIADAFRARGQTMLSCSDNLDAAQCLARTAHTAVVVLGEPWDHTGEARGSALLSLPKRQLELLNAVSSVCKRVVSVVCAGRPVCLAEVERASRAVLYCWHGGVEAGNAIANLLFGDVSPSGKLPVTLPMDARQIPIYYGQRPAARAIDSYYGPGQIKSYLDLPAHPLHPFGFGLSYTSFQYSSIQVAHSNTEYGVTATLECTVRNTGSRAGDEICQCYIQRMGGGETHPTRELVGFQRLSLEPGQEQLVSFTLMLDKSLRYHAWIGGDCCTQNRVVLQM